ncbi:MAG: DUF4298 domain-containing protein [Clostridia bacterium]|nr:DUF4298 domain-containing protein [Clostridia bacterium]
MEERIKENEEKLDKVINVIEKLDSALNDFENIQDNIKEVNRYYGSKEWFEDKEKFENGNILNVKAGVLSEDAIWNTNEIIKELIERMNQISENFVIL